jgi:hypothetical protein
VTLSCINGGGMTLECGHQLLVYDGNKKFISAPDGGDDSDDKHH